jgi:hypothetical protein
MKCFAKLVGVAALASACVASEPIDTNLLGGNAGSSQTPVMSTGAAGQPITTGQAGMTGGAAGMPAAPTTGAAGNVAMAGTSGGASASGAAGAAGTTGAAGAAGAAGQGSGGAGGSGTRPDGGATDAKTTSTDAGVSAYAATWTDIYNKMFNSGTYASNCIGGGCHNPGTQKGLDFSTQAKGYTTVKQHLSVGNPSGSQIVQQISSGRMPQGRPMIPAADQAVIKAWIMAGAMNN